MATIYKQENDESLKSKTKIPQHVDALVKLWNKMWPHLPDSERTQNDALEKFLEGLSTYPEIRNEVEKKIKENKKDTEENKELKEQTNAKTQNAIYKQSWLPHRVVYTLWDNSRERKNDPLRFYANDMPSEKPSQFADATDLPVAN